MRLAPLLLPKEAEDFFDVLLNILDIRSCLKNKCCTTGYDYVNCLYGNETI